MIDLEPIRAAGRRYIKHAQKDPLKSGWDLRVSPAYAGLVTTLCMRRHEVAIDITVALSHIDQLVARHEDLRRYIG